MKFGVWSGWGQPWVTPEDRPWVRRRSWHESNQTHNQRRYFVTLPWKTTEQDRFWYLFGAADRFKWIKLDVWLKQALTVIRFGSCEVRRFTRALVQKVLLTCKTKRKIAPVHALQNWLIHLSQSNGSISRRPEGLWLADWTPQPSYIRSLLVLSSLR